MSTNRQWVFQGKFRSGKILTFFSLCMSILSEIIHALTSLFTEVLFAGLPGKEANGALIPAFLLRELAFWSRTTSWWTIMQEHAVYFLSYQWPRYKIKVLLYGWACFLVRKQNYAPSLVAERFEVIPYWTSPIHFLSGQVDFGEKIFELISMKFKENSLKNSV